MPRERAASGLERTARLLDLVPYISSHQGISVKELGEVFHTSENHLVEDLTTLWMCGLPGYTPLELMEISFESGYVTIQNAQTLQRPRALSKDEALSLILGLNALHDQVSTENPSVALEINALINKLSNVVGSSITSRISNTDEVSASIRSTLTDAISRRQRVEITYHSIARDSVTTRTILPLDSQINNEVEYILAFCEHSHSHRTFRLDRILSARISQTPMIEKSLNEMSDEIGKLTTTISISSRHRDVNEILNIQIPAGDVSGSFQVNIEVFSQDWLTRAVMSLGGAATVSQPLAASVAQRASKALLGYKI